MTDRVTLATYYRQTLLSLLERKRELLRLNEQVASAKKVNRPSDDSVASIGAHLSHRAMEEIEQYQSNVDHARSWLQQAESSLQAISDLISMAKERAEQMATGTYTPEQRSTIATDARNFLSQLVSLCNAKVGSDYIFGGTICDTAPVSTDLITRNPASPDSDNTGAGQLWGRGDYTGLYSRKISLTVASFGSGGTSGTPGGGETMTLDYSYVDDFGRTVTGSVTLSDTGSANAVDLGDGVQIYASDIRRWNPDTGAAEDSYHVGDSFTLTVGRHRGNDQALYANLSWANRMRYNYTLDQILQEEGASNGQPKNLLDLLAGWADALEKDPKEQDYFQAVPGGLNPTDASKLDNPNNPSSSARVRVDGDWQSYQVAGTSGDVQKYQSAEEYWDDLKRWAPEFNLGNPVVLASDDLDDATLQARNFRFYLDSSDQNYSGVPSSDNPMTLYYTSTAGTGTVTVTGVGREATVTFADPGGGGNITLYLANLKFISENLGTSDGNIGWYDGAAVHGTAMSPVFYPENTNPDTYTGPPALTMTVTYRKDNGDRAYQTVNIPGTGSTNPMNLDLDGDGKTDLTFYLSEDGTIDDGDYHRLTLEQYNQGEDKSSQLLSQIQDQLATAQANLLKYTADAGSRLNRLDVRDNLLQGDNLRLSDRLSHLEDVDVTQVITELKTYDVLYQAALQATALVSSRTLADYL